VANVARKISALIAGLGGKLAMNWGTIGSKWPLPILEDGHEQAIRYGVLLDWRANRVAVDAATTLTAGDAYPS